MARENFIFAGRVDAGVVVVVVVSLVLITSVLALVLELKEVTSRMYRGKSEGGMQKK